MKPVPQLLEEPLGRPRIFGRLNAGCQQRNQSQTRKQEPNMDETLPRYQALLRCPGVVTGVVTPANAPAPPCSTTARFIKYLSSTLFLLASGRQARAGRGVCNCGQTKCVPPIGLWISG